MDVFTVTKPGGTKDYEFEAYTRLLEDIGIDVANVPRVPEPGTQRRWLYTWHRKEEAEGFAKELQSRTRDGSWQVHQFRIDSEDRGPVAPLDVFEVRDQDGSFMYYLSPASRERVGRLYPQAKLHPLVLTTQARNRLVQQDHNGWDQVFESLTGLNKEQGLTLGGYRMILPYGEIGYEVLPQIPMHG